MDTSQPFISAIATIGIPVTDQHRALAFDTQTLGMEQQLDVPLPRVGDRGVDVGELLRWDGVPPMFAFHDPDGNGLEIIQQAWRRGRSRRRAAEFPRDPRPR